MRHITDAMSKQNLYARELKLSFLFQVYNTIKVYLKLSTCFFKYVVEI
jgi:hypothetical protein